MPRPNWPVSSDPVEAWVPATQAVIDDLQLSADGTVNLTGDQTISGKKTFSGTAPSYGSDLAPALAKRTELLALDANLGTICYRNNLGDKYFCTMPRCEPSDQVPEWFEGRIQLEQENYVEGVTD